MTAPKKDWLVRTNANDIEGPFTFDELIDAYESNTLKVHDEIANSGEKWISAQSLMSMRVRESIKEQEAPPKVVEVPIPVIRRTPSIEPVIWHVLVAAFIISVLFFVPRRDRAPKQLAAEQAQAAGTLNSLLKGRKYEEALSFLKGQRKAVLGSGSLQMVYAALSIRAGENLEETAQMLVTMEKKTPHSEELKFWKGYLLMRQGRFDEASETLLELVPLRAESAPLHYNLAWAYMGVGDADKASYYLDRARLLDPQNIDFANRSPSSGIPTTKVPALEFYVPLR